MDGGLRYSDAEYEAWLKNDFGEHMFNFTSGSYETNAAGNTELSQVQTQCTTTDPPTMSNSSPLLPNAVVNEPQAPYNHDLQNSVRDCTSQQLIPQIATPAHSHYSLPSYPHESYQSSPIPFRPQPYALTDQSVQHKRKAQLRTPESSEAPKKRRHLPQHTPEERPTSSTLAQLNASSSSRFDPWQLEGITRIAKDLRRQAQDRARALADVSLRLHYVAVFLCYQGLSGFFAVL